MANEKRLIDANALDIVANEDGIANGIWIGGRQGGQIMRLVLSTLKKMIEDAPTVDAVEVCIQEVLRYIDRAFDRQRYDSIWLDEKGETHSADVGYSGEWWEDCMKPELLRMFLNVGTKMDGDGNG